MTHGDLAMNELQNRCAGDEPVGGFDSFRLRERSGLRRGARVSLHFPSGSRPSRGA
jgi:hypothetical protein